MRKECIAYKYIFDYIHTREKSRESEGDAMIHVNYTRV